MTAITDRLRGFGLIGAAAVVAVAATAAQQAAPASPQAAAPGPTGPTGFTTSPALTFKAQDIATGFGVGYAVAAGDVNGDRRTDILAISGTELVWFEAPSWERRTILGAGVTTADNVAIAPHDIDGDGRLDVALGAGWTGPNTGTLQWVRQNAPGANPAWEVFPIGAEPTLHRIRWADVDGDGKADSSSRRSTARAPRDPAGTAPARACSSSVRHRLPLAMRGRWRSLVRPITFSTTSS